MRKPLSGMGLDRSGQLRDPLLTANKILVSAQCCAQATCRRAQGCRPQACARRVPSDAGRWSIRGPPRLCLTCTASILVQGSGKTTQSEEDWPCTCFHRPSLEPSKGGLRDRESEALKPVDDATDNRVSVGRQGRGRQQLLDPEG